MKNRRVLMKHGFQKSFFALILCACLSIGLGILLAARLDETRLRMIEAQLGVRFQEQTERSGIFTQSVIQNGGTMLLIWLFVFLPLGEWIAAGVMAVKAMGYGYTGAVLIRAYGGSGFLYTLTHLTPQAAILLPAAVFLCYANSRYGSSFRGKNSAIESRQMLEYFTTLLLAAVCVVLAAFI
ncbi:MAG: stage II sporulation protein M [Clostridiales bacterium]|jgi:hypothetical protein|nr:stage II sporulation protein M [Clostridiales bacterium]